ncbi:glycosyltransferase family 20 protein [Zasmidium cellare ATCC 36951]|uniref:Glycosyltransferase family 20 protein n=1 Tax=Zasmidium cellare ATCC 36951 TaxID=1080233 RepID=A0A6A6CHL0_ZASCE|nr:glycosyltransferase family 20 protein [Zasmidium cellare ATCC 36951]KAF2166541.1 glycosyltransferase family 20 protein [Zasmidium cellare ATCC 36951]
MATTLTVTLFLPNTVNFHEDKATPRRRSPPFKLEQRVASAIDLPTRQSAASLFNAGGPTPPPLTPGIQQQIANEGFFTPGIDAKKRHFAKPGDPRSLLRSDTHAEWGSTGVFNQPRSRAGPLPSASIQDFAKVYDEIREQKEREQRKQGRRVTKPSPHGNYKSRAGSSERGYEGKSWTVEPAVHGNGGLVNAIRETAQDSHDGPGTTWIGTLGFPTDALPENVKEDIADKLLNDHHSQVIYCKDTDIDGHYVHHCKTILWPIFHYQVPDHPKSKAYADHSWKFYKNVNQAFADQVVASYKKGDTIWVHDYHLLLVPKMVRDKLPDAKIGFFLHTAFPSSEIFRCLSTRKELLEGMLGANLIGFQSEEYSSHFLQTCSRLLAVETTAEGVQIDDHFVNVTNRPIGINPIMFDEARHDEEVQQWVKTIIEKYKGKTIIVARDRLDHVHGVRQKLLAYELFLNRHPEWREKVVMIQVATSTNAQTELLTTVSDICTRIDSVHSTLAHQPLVFLRQDIDFTQYIALLTVADVLMISALRDGMNLTAHEYVACQDGRGSEKKYGPLILSEFTGSAILFGDLAIPINPWDYTGQADAIKKALEMGNEDRRARWDKLHAIVETKTGAYWAEKLKEDLDHAYQEHHEHSSAAVPRLSVSQLVEKYKSSERRLFIIDYEGTLAPHKTSSGIPLGSPVRVIDTMNDLMADPKNVVYVMSGRRPEELENHFRTLPKVGLIAENGCFVREFGVQEIEWTHFVDLDTVAQWKQQVRTILEYYQERLEGSYIEERRCSLFFRYEKSVDQEAAIRQAGECVDQINGSCKSMRIHAVPIKQAVLIEQEDFSKGTAAKHVYDTLCDTSKGLSKPDFMVVAGDDREDEVIFKWANELDKKGEVEDVFTVTVGKRNTTAQATLTQGSTGLLAALQKLNKVSADALPRDYFNLPRNKTFPS